MIAGLRPYPAYRDSGTEWLGRVPEHWRQRRLKSSMNNIVDATVSRSPGKLHLALEDVESWTGRIHTDSAGPGAVFESQMKRFLAGDILFGKLRPYLAKVTRPDMDGVCVGEFLVLRSAQSDVCSQYMEFLLRSKRIIDVVSSSTFGAKMPRADWTFIGGLPIALPPTEEQVVIAQFLDDANRRIQRAITAKEKRIALLEEQKQAVIRQTVTGQIDVRTGEPYRAYKDSGVTWLGRVPESWTVVPLRRVTCSRCDGPFGSGLKSSHYTTNGVRVVRLQNIGHGEFKSENAAYVSEEHCAILGDHSVLAGDLLIAGLGDNRHPSGRACVAPATILPAMVKADCFRFRLDTDSVDPQFVAHQLTATAVEASNFLSTGATRQRTNLQTTATRAIGFPGVAEQALIVESITSSTSGIRSAVEAARRQIEHMKEYRTRLIADVVTGKLDVREAAARLPADDPPGVSAAGNGGHPRPPAAGGAGLKTGGPFPEHREEHGG